MQSYWESLISLVYPRICTNCGRPLVIQEDLLCIDCLMDMPKTNYHRMDRNPLTAKMQLMMEVDEAFAFLKFQKSGLAQNLLHKLKYKGEKSIGETMGRWFGAELKNYVSDLDAIIPIPMHKSKLRARGYNQAEVFANGLSEELEVPVINVLKRKENKTTQTKKGRIDRWLDAEELYEFDGKKECTFKHVLIADDVITTGATISGPISLLKKSGAEKISVACIATGK